MSAEAQTDAQSVEPAGDGVSTATVETPWPGSPVPKEETTDVPPPIPAKRTQPALHTETSPVQDGADGSDDQRARQSSFKKSKDVSNRTVNTETPARAPQAQPQSQVRYQEGEIQQAARPEQGQNAAKPDGQRPLVSLLPLSRDTLLKPHGENGEETRMMIPRFMDHINNIKSVIHAIKMDKFPEEIAREVAELQRKKEKRPLTNIDEHTLLPNEVDAAKNDTRTLYALLVEDPQLSLRHDFLWGYTLLHWAAKANNLRSVRLLLDAGADPRAQSHGGLTPLHTAAMSDKTDQIVQLLMEKGADVDMKTNSGLKARDVARGEKRFLLQSRLDCWDFKVVKQVIPNLKAMYM